MKRSVKLPLFFIFLMAVNYLSAQVQTAQTSLKGGTLIYKDHFSSRLDSATWRVECIDSTGDFIGTQKGKLILRTTHGVTVWLKKKLTGNIRISYDRKVISSGGPLDRISDLNQFWMASDPATTDLFTRNGELESYNNLQLYYVGMGGNYNTTTRFRKYNGKGKRDLIAEYTDPSHLITPNKTYHIDLVIKDSEVSFWVDQQRWFSYKDPQTLTEGYFGFRSTKSNQEILNLRIYQL